MTKIQKGMLAATVAWFALIVWGVFVIHNSIEDAGGAKALIIGAGKEVKEVVKEIVEE